MSTSMQDFTRKASREATTKAKDRVMSEFVQFQSIGTSWFDHCFTLIRNNISWQTKRNCCCLTAAAYGCGSGKRWLGHFPAPSWSNTTSSFRKGILPAILWVVVGVFGGKQVSVLARLEIPKLGCQFFLARHPKTWLVANFFWLDIPKRDWLPNFLGYTSQNVIDSPEFLG